MKNFIIKMKDNYVINKVRRTHIPVFDGSPVVRKNIIFSGRVQKVGFRLEIYELAKRLNLTGFVMNMDNGDVVLEAQGENDRIVFLVEHMESLKRAKVINVATKELQKIEENEFIDTRHSAGQKG